MHMKCSLRSDVHARERGGTAEMPQRVPRQPAESVRGASRWTGQDSLLSPTSHPPCVWSNVNLHFFASVESSFFPPSPYSSGHFYFAHFLVFCLRGNFKSIFQDDKESQMLVLLVCPLDERERSRTLDLRGFSRCSTQRRSAALPARLFVLNL